MQSNSTFLGCLHWQHMMLWTGQDKGTQVIENQPPKRITHVNFMQENEKFSFPYFDLHKYQSNSANPKKIALQSCQSKEVIELRKNDLILAN